MSREKIDTDIKENLNIISNWLDKNANKIYKQSLNKPVDPTLFIQLENIIGCRLPDDFKELYLWHNGLNNSENLGNLFYAMDFFPIEKIIRDFDINSNLLGLAFEGKHAELISSEYDKRKWIIFGFDGSHTYLCLDLSPSNKGFFGQVLFLDEEYLKVILIAKSINDLVRDFAIDLSNNKYFLNEDALEEEEHFLDTVEEIDIINWNNSERWRDI